MRAYLVFVVLTGLLMIGSCVSAQVPQRCTEEEANRAEDGIDGLSNWTLVFEAFKQYGQCDDGAVAEGYDDKIVGLLVNRWDTVTELSRIARSNPDFEHFVLKHIDTLMSPNQGKAIIENARNRCPASVTELCRHLEAKAQHPDG